MDYKKENTASLPGELSVFTTLNMAKPLISLKTMIGFMLSSLTDRAVHSASEQRMPHYS